MDQSIPWDKIKVDLGGKVAVLFGASVGIGAATGKLLALCGAKVVLASRNKQALDELAADIKAGGGEALPIRTDVSNYAEVQAAVDLAAKEYGGVDIVVNNAGINGNPRPVEEWPEDEFDKIMDVNFKGVWYGMKAGIPAMKKRGGGSIVNIASVGGVVAAPGISPYCASKHAIIGLSKSAALDCAPGIRVNVIAPGAINTAIFNDWQETDEQRNAMVALHPLGRVGEPYEIASSIAWMASDAASYVTGAVLVVDGGYIVP